jgi:hypothetical protein
VPQYNDLARPTLLAISKLSGDQYRDTYSEEILAELRERGYDPTEDAFDNLIRRLADDHYIAAYFMASGRAVNVHLDTNGRKEVEGWPAVPGSVSAEDAERLVAVLQARAEDPALPDTERSKARAAADAVKDLGVQVTATVISGWLKSVGVG